ncbi:MAG: choice-of-anchor J domain-containing protein, partial [Bacteroidota bacterium]
EGTLAAGVTNPYVLSGLDSGTIYEFYVQAVCNGETSTWSGPFAFSTLCNPVDLPWVENFDGVTAPQVPACISVINNNGDNYTWETSTQDPYSSPNSMAIRWNSSLAMDDWFFSPGLNLIAGETYEVKFYYSVAGINYPEKLKVMWGDEPNASGMTGGILWNNDDLTNTEYLEATATFTPGESGIYYVGWHGYSDADQFRIYVDDIQIDVAPPAGITLDLKVILEGAFSPGKSEMMHTIINDVLPLDQPYAPDLPYYGNNNPEWYYEGDEAVDIMPENVVDWVLIELRDAAAPSEAYTSTVISQKAALLLNTGEIVSTDLTMPVFDVEINEGLYVVIYHRNHLAVMSAEALTEAGGIYSWDFTQSLDRAFHLYNRSSYGEGHKELGEGIFGMYGGDGDANGQIQAQDKNNVWNLQSGFAGYFPADFDLNGQVQAQDKNNIWNANSGIGTAVPGDSK